MARPSLGKSEKKMGLLSRLVQPADNEEKISIHAFMAAVAEYARGEVDPGFFLAKFGVAAGKENGTLTDLLFNVDSGKIDRNVIHDVLLLGESGIYTLKRVEQRLDALDAGAKE